MYNYCKNCYFCSDNYCSALKEPAIDKKTGSCSFKKSKEQVKKEVYASCLRISAYTNSLYGRKTLLDIIEKYPEVKECMVINGFHKEVQLALQMKS